MPDRPLKPDELFRFVNEQPQGDKMFNAIQAFMAEDVEPSLHDLVLQELIAKNDAFKNLLIQQGRDIRHLKAENKDLQEEIAKLKKRT